MPKKSLLPRGFKADAERKALLYREELGILPYEPLCGFKLAKYLDIEILNPIDIFPSNINIDELVGNNQKDKGWSALTMQTAKGNQIIIHNHLHSPFRQQSNLMHEIAHIICKHKHATHIDNVRLPTMMREYNHQNEEEAIYLGSALQISREGLIWCLKQGIQYEEIANYYTASSSMVNFRINTTGVKRQLNYLKI